MKAISLHQPYASAVALGLKKFETRNRVTNVRGRIAIHAAKARSGIDAFDFLCTVPDVRDGFHSGGPLGYLMFDDLPFGAIIATADLIGCFASDSIGAEPMITSVERVLGDYSPGRFAWRIVNVHSLDRPIPFKGRQGWFEVPDLAAEGKA